MRSTPEKGGGITLLSNSNASLSLCSAHLEFQIKEIYASPKASCLGCRQEFQRNCMWVVGNVTMFPGHSLGFALLKLNGKFMLFFLYLFGKIICCDKEKCFW